MDIFKVFKKESIIAAVLYVIAGLVLIIFPETTAKTIGYVFAGVLIILGIKNIINYFKREIALTFYHNDLVIAAICIIAGITVAVKVEAVVSFIPFILGVFVTISGIIKLQNALNLRRMNNGGSLMVLIMAVINIIIGLMLTFNPFKFVASLIRIIGIGLFLSGVTDIITIIFIGNKMKNYRDGYYTQKDVINGEVLGDE